MVAVIVPYKRTLILDNSCNQKTWQMLKLIAICGEFKIEYKLYRQYLHTISLGFKILFHLLKKNWNLELICDRLTSICCGRLPLKFFLFSLNFELQLYMYMWSTLICDICILLLDSPFRSLLPQMKGNRCKFATKTETEVVTINSLILSVYLEWYLYLFRMISLLQPSC